MSARVGTDESSRGVWRADEPVMSAHELAGKEGRKLESVLSNAIVLEGLLCKRFSRRRRKWNERHFVLRGPHILYYTSRPTRPEEAKSPRGVFSLTPGCTLGEVEAVTLKVNKKEREGFQFVLLWPDRRRTKEAALLEGGKSFAHEPDEMDDDDGEDEDDAKPAAARHHHAPPRGVAEVAANASHIKAKKQAEDVLESHRKKQDARYRRARPPPPSRRAPRSSRS